MRGQAPGSATPLSTPKTRKTHFRWNHKYAPRTHVSDEMASECVASTSVTWPGAMQRCEAIDLGAGRTYGSSPCVTYDHCAVERDVPDRPAFLVATGCRIGEAPGLTWDRVDLDHGWSFF
jgi:hypothetical protein